MVELRPADPQARGILATAYLSVRQTKEGVAELRKGAELARGTALEHKLLAVAEQEAGNWREVIAHLEQARESPPDLWVYWLLAKANLALGEEAQALAAADRGVEQALQPRDDPASPPQVRGRWRGIVAHSPSSGGLASLYLKRAVIYHRQKKYEAALADLNTYHEVYPGGPHLHTVGFYQVRASAHFHLGHYEQALADIATDDDFSNAWILPDQVASCPDEKFRAGMVALAGKAIERSRGKVGGYFARGSLYAALKQYDKAKADYEKAAELGGPTDAGALNNVAWLFVTSPAAEHRDPKLAVTLATKAVELAPKAGLIWNTLGVAHYRAGDYRAAVVALEKSRELQRGHDSFDWFFLAMAHWQLGHKKQARTWYDQAVAWMDKHMPQNAELIRFRAEAAALLAGVK
jgi:tetratricopeptide (TPR) repeat protein